MSRNLLETATIIGLLLMAISSLTVLIELSISMSRTPCENWPNGGSNLENCSFSFQSGTCGLFTVLNLDNNQKFYFSPDPFACIVTLACSACAVVFALALFFILLWLLCCKLDGFEKPSRKFGLEIFAATTCIAWLLSFIIMIMSTVGYAEMCNYMRTPRCNSPSEFHASEFNCHQGKFDLLPCTQFSSETFFGRLAVALGMSWIGLIACSVSAVAMLILFYRSHKYFKELKKKKILESRKNLAIYYPGAMYQNIDDEHQPWPGNYGMSSNGNHHDNTNDNNPQQLYQQDYEPYDNEPYDGGYRMILPPIPNYPTTDRVEDVLIMPSASRTALNEPISDPVKESSF